MASRKLTVSLKNSIIGAVLQKIETIDYDEQIWNVARRESLDQLPIELRNHLDYLDRTWVGYPFNCYINNNRYVASNLAKRKGDELRKLANEQDNKIKEARSILRAALNSCTTVKQFQERYPEFASFVNDYDAPTANLPAVVDLKSKLVELGFKE